jgi:hypothetical protein
MQEAEKIEDSIFHCLLYSALCILVVKPFVSFRFEYELPSLSGLGGRKA